MAASNSLHKASNPRVLFGLDVSANQKASINLILPLCHAHDVSNTSISMPATTELKILIADHLASSSHNSLLSFSSMHVHQPMKALRKSSPEIFGVFSFHLYFFMNGSSTSAKRQKMNIIKKLTTHRFLTLKINITLWSDGQYNDDAKPAASEICMLLAYSPLLQTSYSFKISKMRSLLSYKVLCFFSKNGIIACSSDRPNGQNHSSMYSKSTEWPKNDSLLWF